MYLLGKRFLLHYTRSLGGSRGLCVTGAAAEDCEPGQDDSHPDAIRSHVGSPSNELP